MGRDAIEVPTRQGASLGIVIGFKGEYAKHCPAAEAGQFDRPSEGHGQAKVFAVGPSAHRHHVMLDSSHTECVAGRIRHREGGRRAGRAVDRIQIEDNVAAGQASAGWTGGRLRRAAALPRSDNLFCLRREDAGPKRLTAHLEVVRHAGSGL